LPRHAHARSHQEGRADREARPGLVQAWKEGGDLFNETERAALAWAETVTRVAQTGVPDDAYQAARSVFAEKELIDLTIAISLMNASNRMAISFRNTPHAAIKSKAKRSEPHRDAHNSKEFLS
jgi:alkylhydroperoxidase family enzyme